MALTDKQEMFCREYLVDLNATQAAIRAGYSDKTANRIGSENLSKLDIQKRISELKSDRNEVVKVDAEYVLKRLVEIDKMDVLDILDDDGRLKAVSEWPKPWRTTLSGFDISTTIYDRDESTEETILKKIKWPDKVKNLELLGKHIGVQAFRENVKTELTGKDGGPVQIELTDEQLEERLKEMGYGRRSSQLNEKHTDT
ncbi:terminase small subunit [Photorhabdus laumondii subsp. laumondii]|uniref:Terminase small subunit n=1 Tax=Photorhabdus laumondii subsp. laumondii TaxID=141679 RepID=A0A6L9JPS0_PHOLM|nr:terminase small subunit [Photorhabdus laumondii]MCC8384955.1 terminase small subunit [Photorhabdus laumondii]MCC8413661.1 terminase small subunit [Photorhabdus laumondii]NDK96823.1 terminase small subunit [Photorhabdus laumondii subsp. laumondii]NDL23019.1 terminase small subunit [Photorhabdus laumondii subsp. laumondii]NDL32018.1 terminase small subunit [Photorhabdus laumondii subsp. laumondii]